MVPMSRGSVRKRSIQSETIYPNNRVSYFQNLYSILCNIKKRNKLKLFILDLPDLLRSTPYRFGSSPCRSYTVPWGENHPCGRAGAGIWIKLSGSIILLIMSLVAPLYFILFHSILFFNQQSPFTFLTQYLVAIMTGEAETFL